MIDVQRILLKLLRDDMVISEHSGKLTLHVSIDNPDKVTKVDTINLILGSSMLPDVHSIVIQSMEDGSVEVLITAKDECTIGKLG